MNSSPDRVDMSVVLVCWNNKTYLEPCLDSLYNSGVKSTFDVVVVDNGSEDGSQMMLQEKFPQVMIIQNNHNVGLGKASNQGIEATHGKYVLLLNNDTIVSGKTLDAFVDILNENPRLGAAGGKLLNPDGSFQAGYAKFSTLLEEFLITTGLGDRFWNGYPSHFDADAALAVGWLSSACLLLRRSALNEVGLLNEEYFIYGDEADIQYRLNQAGWQVYYLPHATTIHYGGRSMDRWKRRKMVYRGKIMFYTNNYAPIKTISLRVMLWSLSLAKLLPWGAAYLFPRLRERAQLELDSNLSVMQLCWKLV